MSTIEMDSRVNDAAVKTYTSLEEYDWDSDPDFQGGLQAILGSDPSEEQAGELTLRARCFYYSKKFDIPVDFDGYKAWRRQARHNAVPISHPPNTNVQGTISSLPSLDTPTATLHNENKAEPAATYPTSFSHIVDLITTGKPIPGIKEVPSTILSGQGTASSKTIRKKPWEKEQQA